MGRYALFFIEPTNYALIGRNPNNIYWNFFVFFFALFSVVLSSRMRVHLADRFPFKFVLHDSYGFVRAPVIFFFFVDVIALWSPDVGKGLYRQCCGAARTLLSISYGLLCKSTSSSVGFPPIKRIIRFPCWHRIKWRRRWQRNPSFVVQFCTQTKRQKMSIYIIEIRCAGAAAARRISHPCLFNEKRLARRSDESDHIT